MTASGARSRATARARERTDAVERLGRSFKGAMAALRRLRGREVRRPGELGDAQYSLLFCLRDHDEMSLGDLAVAAELSPASVTEMLDAMVAAGLVERFRSDRDRRGGAEARQGGETVSLSHAGLLGACPGRRRPLHTTCFKTF